MKVGILGNGVSDDVVAMIDYLFTLKVGDIVYTTGITAIEKAAIRLCHARGIAVEVRKPDYGKQSFTVAQHLARDWVRKEACFVMEFPHGGVT